MPANIGAGIIGEGRLEKIFVIHWGWGQRENGKCSRCSATELEMRMVGLDLEEQKER